MTWEKSKKVDEACAVYSWWCAGWACVRLLYRLRHWKLPDGTTRIRTISGKTGEECEEKLAALIAEMKAERARLKEEGIASENERS